MTRTTQTAPLSSGSLGAGSSTSFTFDATASTFARLLIKNTAGAAVAATSGVQITIKPGVDATPDYSTLGYSGGIIPSVISTLQSNSIDLPPGPYTITLINLDVTNSVTVAAVLDFYTS